MKLLAVVLARGNSKRLPNKNIRELGGRPLLEWTINITKPFGAIVETLVSTDSPDIAQIGSKAGALVPWLRPTHLATDSASSIDATVHALDWYEDNYGSVDGVMLLQPTSPFRKENTIEQAIQLFALNPQRPVVAVSPTHPNPAWCFIEKDGRFTPLSGWDCLRERSQALPPVYHPNGSLYLIAPEILRRERSFYTEDLQTIVIETSLESLDIDDEWDWFLAEQHVKFHFHTVDS